MLDPALSTVDSTLQNEPRYEPRSLSEILESLRKTNATTSLNAQGTRALI